MTFSAEECICRSSVAWWFIPVCRVALYLCKSEFISDQRGSRHVDSQSSDLHRRGCWQVRFSRHVDVVSVEGWKGRDTEIQYCKL